MNGALDLGFSGMGPAICGGFLALGEAAGAGKWG